MKNRRSILLAKIGTAVAVIPVLLLAYSGGPPRRKTGAPGDGTCIDCHRGAALNSGSGRVTVAFPGNLTAYTPGGPRQEWTVTVADPAARIYGFELSARLASNETNGQAGSFDPGADGGTRVLCDDSSVKSAQGCPAAVPVQFVEHTAARISGTFTFFWTPPATDVGDVKVYIAGNAANGDGTNRGDLIYTASYTLKAAAPPSPPSIAADRGVTSGASFQPGIVAGSWTTIFGANLAAVSRTWRPDEIVDGKLPLQLEGVSVTIDGKPAAVYYVSPTQLNVQAPNDDALGAVEVKVTNAQGVATVNAPLNRFQPAFFLFDPENRKYLAAVHSDGSFLGKPALFSTVATTPAQPGEVVLLFGTGFGPTTPAVPSGQVFSGAAKLSNDVQILIGGTSADVQFAGLSGAGLYQFNVKIPDTAPNGDLPVVAMIGGVSSPDGALLTVQKK